MTQIKLEFISEGFKQILSSEGVQSLVTDISHEIKGRADAQSGGEHTAETWYGRFGGGRYVASVTTADDVAAMAESENKTLTGAVR